MVRDRRSHFGEASSHMAIRSSRLSTNETPGGMGISEAVNLTVDPSARDSEWTVAASGGEDVGDTRGMTDLGGVG